MRSASTTHLLSRRVILAASAGLVGTTVGCDALSTEPSSETGDSADAPKGKEAPALANRVERGELPALEDRLPATPLVIEPTDRVGRYGGRWQTGFLGAANVYWVYYTAGYDGLVRWDPEWKEVLPNLAESVEASPDGREYTFTLRAGTRWSDGKPFTTADIMFSYTDGMLNEELMPLPPTHLVSGSGTPAEIVRVDDLTFRIVFDEPNALFLEQMASQSYGTLFGDTVAYPRHYLEQFHPVHNENVDAEIEKGGYSEWTELFAAKGDYTANVELPTLNAWTLTAPLGDANRVVVERNPYYWKTDPDGSQLPYLDGIDYDIVNDAEAMLLKVTNGEYHFHYPVINTLQNKPVIAQGREDGDYALVDMIHTRMNWVVIALNLTHENQVKRDLFQNKDFRIGLSHAINRSELIDVVFQRTGSPWQAAPRKETEFYDEELATQFTEFDPDRANAQLDRAGLEERNGDDIRIGPDGEPIFFVVDVQNGDPQAVEAMEYIRGNWREVGVDIRVNSIDRSLFYTRKAANKHEANVWGGDGGLNDALFDPRWYFPYSHESNYAIPWATWFTSRGEEGVEPPPATRQQMELYWEILAEPDAERRKEMFREILRIAKDEFYAIGTVLPEGVYGVRRNDMRNVPDPMILAYRHPDPGPDRPEQFYIDE